MSTTRSPHPSATLPASYAVVGTAGHIDHGKSALVRALTGVDPDRLEEEKRRGMTIDLGFAHFDLPSGRRVGLVDVPGHERLIKNMLAGATGIDLVLLVVAADEGVMPQTREHLDILRFLRVSRGVIGLNKIDLASDPEWVALVREDIQALTRGTFLERAPVIPVSARTGEGIPQLVDAMDAALRGLGVRSVDAPARLPIDRSFTMAGFGTVVTGTLWAGRIRAADVLELLPAGREVRVRQLQSHGLAVDEVLAGQRVAVNVVGAAKEEIVRGHVLAAPRSLQPTTLLDARVRLLEGAVALRHNERVRFYVASDDVIGRIRLLDRARLIPGDTVPAQLRLERPTVVARGDPFVLRRYSPMITLGGGEVITAHAPFRRRGAEAVQAVTAQEGSGFEDQVGAALDGAGVAGTTVDALAREVGATRDRVAAQVSAFAQGERALDVRGRLFAAGAAGRVRSDVLRALAQYHAAAPWRRGMPRDELKRRVFGSGDDRLYSHVLDTLVTAGGAVVDGSFVRLTEFAPRRTPSEVQAAERIAEAFRRGRYAPPGREAALALVPDGALGNRMLQALVDEGALVSVGEDVVFHRDVLEEIQARVLAHLAEHGEITVATLRDLLGSSRKFVLTVLEYFDALRLTRRVGDKRVLARPAPRA